MQKPAGQAPIRLFAVFLIFGVFTLVLSFMIGDSQKAYEEVDATVLPAKASLVSVEIREWTGGGGNWGAFGNFYAEAGSFRGRAEGSLEPPGVSGKYSTPRSTAEGWVSNWKIGQTYDGWWDPGRPEWVFFYKVDPQKSLSSTRKVRLAGAALTLAGILLAFLPKRVPAGS